MSKSLNSDTLKIVANLYDSKTSFREGLDRLLHDEIRSAMDLSDRLNKFIANGTDTGSSKPTKTVKDKTASTGKRGRPPGSKNKPKAEAPSSPETVNEPVEAKMTHGNAIVDVLKESPDGLSASEIHEALSALSIEGYSAPSKGTLQTTLVGLRDKKVLKTKGQRPNTKYLVK